MRTEPREAPKVPDHEVLRKIGSGAYGEVWLARSVTGAWRAVKVVCREDFDDERTFEREFDGILRYEPISRDHPSLVQILHVGRTSQPEPLYYYVMELGDDVRQGQAINAVEYEPRTLRTEALPNGDRVCMPVDEVLDIGISLAEGLQHLHDAGLAHRDVKPANIIFVEGRAKLADLGLVAARDQRTFVGTEGFVPPEGPGSAGADIYSLGKVLYELATGLDRMQFPELPDELPEGDNLSQWRKLNSVICEVCEPRMEERGIETGAELSEALRALKEGRRPRSRKSGNLSIGKALAVLTMAALLVVSIFLLPDLLKDDPLSMGTGSSTNPNNPSADKVEIPEPEPEFAQVIVVSSPPFAAISLADGTPIVDRYGREVREAAEPFELEVGTKLQIRFSIPGYRTEVSEPLVVTEEGLDIYEELVRFSPPQRDLAWTDSLGLNYTPKGEFHLSDRAISAEAFGEFMKTQEAGTMPPTFKLSEVGQAYDGVLLTEQEATDYARWLRTQGIERGNLSSDFKVKAVPDDRTSTDQLPAAAVEAKRALYRVRVEEILWASVALRVEPEGAAVFKDGFLIAFANPTFVQDQVEPGQHVYELSLAGYKKVQLQVDLEAGQKYEKTITMEPNNSAKFGRPWNNSLGMSLLPLGDSLLISKFETRVSDFEAYLKASGLPEKQKTNFEKKGAEPVSMVTHSEAVEFCRWLTAKEQAEERINKLHHYRLPTDEEWSLINGLEEKRDSPRERHGRRERYPWGTEWPPTLIEVPVGNFADESAAAIPGVMAAQTIPNYQDGYTYTAPVGSFPANELGFHDLAGNVQEWIADSYGGTGGLKNSKFARGGGFLDYRPLSFDLGHRHIPREDAREPDIGFRVVLAKNPDAFSDPSPN